MFDIHENKILFMTKLHEQFSPGTTTGTELNKFVGLTDWDVMISPRDYQSIMK